MFAAPFGASRARGFVFVLVMAFLVFVIGHALSGTNVALPGFPVSLMSTLAGRAGAQPAGLAFAAGTARRMAQHFALAAWRAARLRSRGVRALAIPSAFLSVPAAFDQGPAHPV
ncbi:MAG: hypothetical protein WDM81_06435 [Rhizomicrobium sp.]